MVEPFMLVPRRSPEKGLATVAPSALMVAASRVGKVLK